MDPSLCSGTCQVVLTELILDQRSCERTCNLEGLLRACVRRRKNLLSLSLGSLRRAHNLQSTVSPFGGENRVPAVRAQMIRQEQQQYTACSDNLLQIYL